MPRLFHVAPGDTPDQSGTGSDKEHCPRQTHTLVLEKLPVHASFYSRQSIMSCKFFFPFVLLRKADT